MNRQFNPGAPNVARVTDMAHLPMMAGTFYLVAFLAWFSRPFVSWKTGEILETAFCRTALRRASMIRQPPKSLFAHSDRGIRYAGEIFRQAPRTNHSISPVKCLDNAAAENFESAFGTGSIDPNRAQRAAQSG